VLESTLPDLTALELCAGAGGQALGLHQAEFGLEAAVELDVAAVETLRDNSVRLDLGWNINPGDVADVREVQGKKFKGVDLVAAGVPCPPFSIAGKQLGGDDDRDLFPAVLDVVRDAKPAAILFENVRGLGQARFEGYRAQLIQKLESLHYNVIPWRILNSSDHGVPQMRRRFVLVAFKNRRNAERFKWPGTITGTTTVGETLQDAMAARGWPGAARWASVADGIAPTIVGGSKKHGGPDLGPTRAKREWARLGVDGMGIWDEPPGPDFPVDELPRLTVRMVALLQGFRADWQFSGRKTAAYRQVGNAFPPPVAEAVGRSIAEALTRRTTRQIAPRSVCGGVMINA
jgi:DNA (cytosine-5)-methyltransferase 1